MAGTTSKPFLKEYQVFNADQCQGLPQIFSCRVKATARQIERIEAVDRFGQNTRAVIVEGGQEASYSPSLDRIRLPPVSAFRSQADHASTLLHELAHWTGHETRLNRLHRGDLFGSDGYAKEELLSGMPGSVFVNGEWWTATLDAGSVQAGENVRVIGRRGINLIVTRV